MTTIVKGLITFAIEAAIYFIRSIRNNRGARKNKRPLGWRPPDENITGNRNSQNESNSDE